MSKKCTTKRYCAEIRLANGHFFSLLLIYGHICATTLSTFSTCQIGRKFVLCSCSIFNMVLHTCVKMALGIWHSIPFSHGFILNCVEKMKSTHTFFASYNFCTSICEYVCAGKKRIWAWTKQRNTRTEIKKRAPEFVYFHCVLFSLSLWRSPLYSGSSSFPHFFYS